MRVRVATGVWPHKHKTTKCIPRPCVFVSLWPDQKRDRLKALELEHAGAGWVQGDYTPSVSPTSTATKWTYTSTTFEYPPLYQVCGNQQSTLNYFYDL